MRLLRFAVLALALAAIAPGAAFGDFRNGRELHRLREAREPRAAPAEGSDADRAPWLRRSAERRADRMATWREALEARRAQAMEAFEVGRRGERVIRRQVLALNPSPRALAQAQSLAFTVERETQLDGLGMRLLVLQAPAGMTAVEALAALQAADPEGLYELNHVFTPSSDARAQDAREGAAAAPVGDGRGLRIGMVDAGVDAAHPALAGARLTQRAFASDAPAPAPHGTAVASLLVGDATNFRGALPGAELFVADVFGDAAQGGSARDVAEAIGWMAASRVAVVNVSLAGPPNRVLEAICREAAQRGVTLVAAVGNDGPAAPVAFPAAYPGVVAVTAIDARRRIYVAANRGPEVAFAASGVGVRAALDGGIYAAVSGTSFAAPRVAARLARLPEAERRIERLAAEAQDLGPPGRDPVFGFGAV